MTPTHLVVVVAVLAAVMWRGRWLPLSGVRRRLVIGARVAALAALWLAIWGPVRRRVHEVPRRLVYLVDASASIDASQQEWIARRIASLESLRPARLSRAIIAFGAETQPVVPFGARPMTDPDAIRRAVASASVSRDQTNLETALLSIAGLGSQGEGASVVLLSDGRETRGNVTGILSYVRRLGCSVFPTRPPLRTAAKTVWETLAVSAVAQRGSPVALQLVLSNRSATAKSGEVTVGLEGVPIKRQRIRVRPGWQTVTVTVPALRKGTMALDIDLSVPEDELTERRSAYTEVEGPPQVLLVTDRTTTLPALAQALKRRDMDIALARPEDLPTGTASGAPPTLLDDDAVIFFNLPKSALTTEQTEALRRYVEQFGGGLISVGLGGDLAHELSSPAPLDALLPVRFEPKGLQEAKRRVCIVLLIDRSASMIGPRIAATKRAAVELVKQLAPEDLVGVLAFDTKPYVIVEVQQAGQLGSTLVEKLVQLRSSGGTDVYPALTAAQNRLELTGATVKHIILLSDGNTPFHADAYQALVEAFTRSQITVSTIGIGSAFVNADYLEWLARSTGGTFYPMRHLDELPRLVARDTQQALARLPFTEGAFRPTRTPTTDWFDGIDAWPTLRGYFTATAKPGASVDLLVGAETQQQPLLARWTLGTGRVVSFTSDAEGRWSPDWIRWPGFDGVWAQVVRWAMRPRLTEELFVWIDESRPQPRLVLEGILHDPRAQLIAADGSRAGTLPLIQTGAWRWSAPLEDVPSGWYQLALASDAGQAGTVFAKRWVQIGTAPAIGELPNQPPRETLLRAIAHATSGAYEMPDGALLPAVTTATLVEPLSAWWLSLAIVLLLVEIALRGSTML